MWGSRIHSRATSVEHLYDNLSSDYRNPLIYHHTADVAEMYPARQ